MRVVLVGCGKMGGYHLNAIRNFEVVDSVSVVEPGELSKELLNNEVHFSSLQECLASGPHDLAVVASPTTTHVDAAEMLLEAGLKVLVEKPISNSLDAARRLERFSSSLAVGHIERFNPVVEALVDATKGRRVDTCSFFRLSSLPTRIADVGVDLDLSIHDLDLARYMLGDFNVSDRSKQTDETGRVVDAKYSLSHGETSATIHSSWLHDSIDRRIVIESEGDLLIGDLVAKTVTVNNEPVEVSLDGPDQLTKQFGSFLEFCAGKDTKVCSYSDAFAALEAV